MTFSVSQHQGRLEARLSDYLDRHYKLAGQTIFLASDAGPGYEPAKLLSLVPQGAHGEYFLDRYHCLQKIEHYFRAAQRISHASN